MSTTPARRRRKRSEAVALRFADLVALEPLLGKLLAKAKEMGRQAGANRWFCRKAAFGGYGIFRNQGLEAALVRLVGTERPKRHRVLSTETALKVARKVIRGALPSCRNCFCPARGEDGDGDGREEE